MRNFAKTLLIFVALLVIHFTPLFAQSLLIDPQGDGGFENGTTFEENGWTVVNHSVNQWFVGGASTPSEGDNAAYISNDGGVTNIYTNTVTQVSHFYRDVTVPTGENAIYLSFKWKALAESCCDYIRVWVTPTSHTPVAGTLTTVGNSGGTQILGNLNNQTGYQSVINYQLPPTLAGTTFRLIFQWRNDNSSGVNPPGSIDEIMVISQAPVISNAGGSFTIDNTLPTGGTNFNSFSEAITDANLGVSLLTGDLIFNVVAGQEFFENPPQFTASGNENFEIIFQKSGLGVNPKIRPTGTSSSSDFGFCISGGDYITLDGIDIEIASGNMLEYGYWIRQASAINGASHNTIINCKIILNKSNLSSNGIYQQTNLNPTSASGTNNSNRYENVIIENSAYGIYLQGNTNTTFRDMGNTIKGCTIGAPYTGVPNGSITYRGIWLSHNDNAVIESNTVRNISFSGNVQGIYADNVRSEITISKNKVHGIIMNSIFSTSISTGIQIILNTTGTFQRTANIINNMVYDILSSYNSSFSSIGISGITIGDANNLNVYNVYNNSVRIDGSSSIHVPNVCLNIVNVTSTHNIRNNIFTNYTANQTGGGRYCISTPSINSIGSAGSIMNNNNLYIQNPALGRVGLTNTTPRATLSDWTNALTGNPGTDNNSVTIDPKFISPSNLKIAVTSLNMDGLGVPISAVTDDIEGDPRDPAMPDLGADEYTPIPGIDVGIVGLASPSATGCYTNAEDVTVIMKNNSFVSHDLANDPVSIIVSATGPNSYSESHIIDTGTLGPLAEAQYSIPVSFDMSLPGTYTFNATTMNDDDLVPENNSMNPAIRTVVPGVDFSTFSQDFEGTYPGWTVLGWTINSTHGNLGNGLFSSFSSGTNRLFKLPKFTTVNNSDRLSFDYRLVNTTSYPNIPLPNSPDWGIIEIESSVNCEESYQLLATIDPSTHISKTGWENKSYDLSQFAGEVLQIRVKITHNSGSGTWFADFDNFNLVACEEPVNQPSNLDLVVNGLFNISGSFDAAPDNPTGYLVVRYPTGDIPSNPQNGFVYAGGNTIGSGTVVIRTTSPSFNALGLQPETGYDFYIYSYIHDACGAGPMYKVDSPLIGTATTTGCSAAGIITVGDQNADFTSLGAVITHLLAVGISSSVIIELQSGYTSTTTLSISGNIPCMDENNTVTIRPATDVTEPIILTSTGNTININGGRYFTFDGRPGGTGTEHMLTIRSTTGNIALRLSNGASYNQIRYCNIRSNNIFTNSGTVYIGNSNSTTGNNYNLIDHCNISGHTVLTSNAVYSDPGSLNQLIQYNTISNCNIFNFDRNGVYMGTRTTDWTISGNSFYHTDPVLISGFFTISPIYCFWNSTQNVSITNNFIGGTAPLCGGAQATFTGTSNFPVNFTGINITTDTFGLSNIENNVIKNISIETGPNVTSHTSNFNGILINEGIYAIKNNMIGDPGITNSIKAKYSSASATSGSNVRGIYAFQTSSTGRYNSTLIENNQISGFEITRTGTAGGSFNGIVAQSVKPVVIKNNIIGSATIANSINNLTGSVAGISSGTFITNIKVEENLIANFTGVFGSGITLSGISTNVEVLNNIIHDFNLDTRNITILGVSPSGTVQQRISGNQIFNINQTYSSNLSSDLFGIAFASPITGTNIVEKNLIYNLNLVAPNAFPPKIVGIRASSGNAVYQNNMVALGENVSGNIEIVGMEDVAGSNNFYFNSVLLRGSNNGNRETFAFRSLVVNNLRNFRNNIFANLRQNAGTGIHYGVSVGGTVANPTGLNMDYNNIYVNGPTNSFGKYNNINRTSIAAWQTATGQDMNTITVDPLFANPDATVLNLHLTAGTPCEGAGILIATVLDDFDGDVRADFTPTDIGADAGDYGAPCGPIPTAAADGNNNLCVGATLNLVGTTDIGTSFLWTGPNGFSSNDQNPEIVNLTKESAGLYFLTATLDDCSSEPAVFELILNGLEVWTGDDSGSGTLRGALVCAQNGDIITIDENVSQINFLTPLSVQKNVSIHDNFNPAAILYFDFDLSGFDIAEFGLEIDGNVHLKNLDIRHKNNSPIKPLLLNKSFLDLENITFRGATPPYLIHESGANINIIANTQVIVLE